MLSVFLTRRREREDEDISLNNNSKTVTMEITSKNNNDCKKLICSLRHICGPIWEGWWDEKENMVVT